MCPATVIKSTRALATLGLVLACGLVSGSALALQVCVDDTYELTGPSGTDDVCPAAQLSSRQTHAACDQDWMRVAVTAGVTYVFTTTALAAYSDTVIDLYDGCTRLIASNDNFSGRASQVVWTATRTGAVDVRVTQAGGVYGATRAYDIVLTTTTTTTQTTLLVDGFE